MSKEINNKSDLEYKKQLIFSKIEQEINFTIESLNKELKQLEYKNKTIFLSYSQDSNDHVKWVGNFAEELTKNDIFVLYDLWDVALGEDFPEFMEKIATVDYIITIFSHGYSEKIKDSKNSGVKQENRLIKALISNGIEQRRIVLILCEEGLKDSIPPFYMGKKYLEIMKDNDKEEKILELVRHIYEEPEIKRPNFGFRPKF